MKRGLIAAGALLAAVIAGLPWALGAHARSLYENALAYLQEQGMRVLDSRYDRGWLSSSAAVQLALPFEFKRNPGLGAASIQVRSRVHHGHLGLGIPRLAPAAALIESRAELPSLESPPLLLETRVEMDGSGVTRIRLPVAAPAPADERPDTPQDLGELRFTAGFATAEGRFELSATTLAAILNEQAPLWPAGDSEPALDRIVIGTTAGAVRARLSLASRAPASEGAEKPEGWLERLVAEGEISIPRPLLQRLLEGWQRRELLEALRLEGLGSQRISADLKAQSAAAAQDRLAFLVRRRWLGEQAGALVAAFRLADALLTINGKTLPVAAAPSP
jgi:hypothetical protein